MLLVKQIDKTSLLLSVTEHHNVACEEGTRDHQGPLVQQH